VSSALSIRVLQHTFSFCDLFDDGKVIHNMLVIIWFACVWKAHNNTSLNQIKKLFQLIDRINLLYRWWCKLKNKGWHFWLIDLFYALNLLKQNQFFFFVLKISKTKIKFSFVVSLLLCPKGTKKFPKSNASLWQCPGALARTNSNALLNHQDNVSPKRNCSDWNSAYMPSPVTTLTTTNYCSDNSNHLWSAIRPPPTTTLIPQFQNKHQI